MLFNFCLKSPQIQLKNTTSCSTSSHGEGQESKKSEKGGSGTDTLSLAGSAPAIQRLCIQVMTDFISPVCVLVLFFGGGFCLFLIKKTLFLIRLVVQN